MCACCPSAHRSHVEHQILHPQRAALAHGGELRGLVVREAQRGELLVLVGKRRHHGQQLDQLPPYQQQRVADLDNVRVVADIAAAAAGQQQWKGASCTAAAAAAAGW
eukprot:TRINITY_DN1862_c0_g1_i3.p6 TRINITY_DN1862_c0_g1~~TRINITY_DN1862_c0_g1_i3.p6  ORF type:complete len:107 (+),score=36.26 TRINITY_DN1862_c0_g1_i3:345-665(+)